MKILAVIPSLHRGGAERVMSLLTQQWESEAHEVVLAVFDASAPAYLHGGRLVDLRSASRGGTAAKAWKALARTSRLWRLMRQERPHHIVTFMESANFPAALAAALAGCRDRLAVSVRNDPARFPPLQRVLMRLLYLVPARVVAPSQGVAGALVRMGLPASRVRSIPNPVLPGAQARPQPQDAPPPACPFVLAVGRLHPQKGFDRLLQAFARLEDRGQLLVILGEGAQRAALEDQARALGIAPRVRLQGNVADPRPWYEAARCFVLSSRHEGWPNVLMEALACGCPAVSFRCDYGPGEIVEGHLSGLLVDEGDIDALARAIQEILDDEPLRHTLQHNGRLRAAHFAPHLIAQRWIAHDHE